MGVAVADNNNNGEIDDSGSANSSWLFLSINLNSR